MQAGSQNVIMTKVGKGRHDTVHAQPRPSRSAWAEILQMHGFPIQTWNNKNYFKGP